KQNKLSPQKVADIKQRFAKINQADADLQKAKGHLSYVDKLKFCIDFDLLGARLTKEMSEAPLAMPDVAGGSANIEKRLEEGKAAGKITEAQAEEIKKALAVLKEKEASSKKVPLKGDQILALGLAMDLLANRVEGLIESSDSLPALETRLNLLDRKIALS